MGPVHMKEGRYWRHLLGRVASDMEATAMAEPDPRRARWFRGRARRIRQLLHAGVPDGWSDTTTTKGETK